MSTSEQNGAPAAPADDRGFIRALGLFPATALNMAQMVGIGPFITIPLIIAAMVVIDPGTCGIRLHRYLVVEDCGVVINPIVVDGQVLGGVAQGAAAALLERVCFDAEGQPASATLMDYLAPTAAEMCPVDIVHLETPSAFSETGAKGMG